METKYEPYTAEELIQMLDEHRTLYMYDDEINAMRSYSYEIEMAIALESSKELGVAKFIKDFHPQKVM